MENDGGKLYYTKNMKDNRNARFLVEMILKKLYF
jgi:hypothetical protein